MKNASFFRLEVLILGLINMFVIPFLAFIRDSFSHEIVRVKGFVPMAVNKLQAVAFEAKAWTYEMYSRWRVDSVVSV